MQTSADRAYANYVLGLLVLVYIVNFIDRSILTILAEPIRRELGLSDTALGFLTGPAFALIYSAGGIPVAYLADLSSRRTILAIGLAFWSAMTAVCGVSSTFLQLALARVGVGLGESAASPPAHSMISDYFPPSTRVTALAIYATGVPLGSGLGQLIGGPVSTYFDWRTAFLVVGLPGIALAILVMLSLREPPRGRFDPPKAAAHKASSDNIWSVFQLLWGMRSFRHFSVAAALHAFYGYGAGAYGPAFFERTHHLSRAEIGINLGLIAMVFGTLSAFLGGRIGDWLARRGDPRWYLWVPALATAAGIPFAAAFYLSPMPYLAFALAIPNAILGLMYLGPTYAMTQALVPPHMRATAAAILLFIINMIGLALGPQLTGVLSDTLRWMEVENPLRWALLTVVTTGSVWSTLHYVLGARPLREDLSIKSRLAVPA